MAAMTLSACFPDFFPPPPALPYADQVHDLTYSDEQYQALMFAEFGPIVPLLSLDLQAAMKLAVTGDDETQPERGSKKRKKNKDDETQPERSSKKKNNNKDDDIQADRSSKKRRRKKKAPPSPRSTNKMIATRLLKRQDIRAPEPSDSEADGKSHTVLRCECGGLPRGSPGCALHQQVPGRSWMLTRGDVPAVGGNGGVLVPRTSTDSRRLVAGYMRWRRSVYWMPSRFYLEKSQKERAYQDAEDEMKRLLASLVLPGFRARLGPVLSSGE